MYKFTEQVIDVPEHDCDITLRFASGKIMQVQCRPSNADVDYNGSLDIILPDNAWVTNWEGDNMKPAKISPDDNCSAFAKQLVTELP